MTGSNQHSELLALAHQKLAPGVITFGAETELARGILNLQEQLEAARDYEKAAADLSADLSRFGRGLQEIMELPSDHDLMHNAVAKAAYEIARRTLDVSYPAIKRGVDYHSGEAPESGDREVEPSVEDEQEPPSFDPRDLPGGYALEGHPFMLVVPKDSDPASERETS